MTHEELLEKFSQELPGEKSHLAFMPFRGSSLEQLKSGISYRDAAVAIILFHNAKNELSTIVTKRQNYDGSHSGQISFPGGKKEVSDRNLLETAIRECYEEIGIDASSFELLKELTPLFVPVSKFLITPYIFYAHTHSFDYVASEREVAHIYELDLINLYKPESIVAIDLELSSDFKMKRVPHFQQGEILIWGATALILNELKDILN
ncbi:NUDIX hydrolase [Fluviicola taffensis]|uniref:NUDIX hydrolase n=1 Tax=Fluviicola taffensis (strain DSM 16823 / NCIMB 13979 / RW262) TaxID=755732 RepID=F2IDU6_FLUTR|nr:CoA pyrophosphatase [Fluviicola taffensis]AEA44488.1 NUDIX hydrolase [Fluviicola taffensis DSM 16823]